MPNSRLQLLDTSNARLADPTSLEKRDKTEQFLLSMDELEERKKLYQFEQDFLKVRNKFTRFRLESQRLRHAEAMHALMMFTHKCVCHLCTGAFYDELAILKDHAEVAEEMGELEEAKSIRSRMLQIRARFLIQNFGSPLDPVAQNLLDCIAVPFVRVK